MIYFKDVRDRPAYCASHVVPLEELAGDLAVRRDHAQLRLGCPRRLQRHGGLRHRRRRCLPQDRARRQIMNSPAWRTQRSLAIITFDEDAQDGQHPAQRVPTIVLGSQGVRRGATDATRYTHYSMLRTVEAALGTGHAHRQRPLCARLRPTSSTPGEGVACGRSRATVSASGGPAGSRRGCRHGGRADGCADPRPRRSSRPPPRPASRSAGWPTSPATPSPRWTSPPARRARRSRPASARGRSSPPRTARPSTSPTAAPTPSPRSTRPPASPGTPDPGRPRPLGTGGHAQTARPCTWPTAARARSPRWRPRRGGPGGSGGQPIPVGRDPRAIALTPDGATAYVLNWLSGTVTPITTATDRPGRPDRRRLLPGGLRLLARSGHARTSRASARDYGDPDQHRDQPPGPRAAGRLRPGRAGGDQHRPLRGRRELRRRSPGSGGPTGDPRRLLSGGDRGQRQHRATSSTPSTRRSPR